MWSLLSHPGKTIEETSKLKLILRHFFSNINGSTTWVIPVRTRWKKRRTRRKPKPPSAALSARLSSTTTTPSQSTKARYTGWNDRGSASCVERTLLATLSLTTIGGFTQGKNLFSAMFAEQGEPMPPFVIFLQKRVLDFTASNSAVAEIFPAMHFQNSLFLGSTKSRTCTLMFDTFTWENDGIPAATAAPSFAESGSLTVTLTPSTREKNLILAAFALQLLSIRNMLRSTSKLTGESLGDMKYYNFMISVRKSCTALIVARPSRARPAWKITRVFISHLVITRCR